MKKNNLNKVLMGIALLGIFIIFTSGCNKYTRYEVLTFFFTGVPHPDEVKGVPGVSVGKIKGRPVPEPEYFVHGPNAAGQCYQCHMMSPVFGFMQTGGEGGQIPGMLVTPLKDLCKECHVPRHGLARIAHWTGEEPAADGSCTFCHDPHKSPFRYMLHKKI